MTDLDALIERARGATVDRAEAERCVRALGSQVQPSPPGRRWAPWLVTAFATAAAVLAVLAWQRDRVSTLGDPVRIGERVAILADPGTAYRIVRSDPDGTEIAVERGAVTARLWRAERPYRLVLSGAGITATATGTVYRLAVGASGPVVDVTEGTVEVRAADGRHVVVAGASWPAGARATDPAAARVLLALSAPEPLPAIDARVATAGGPDASAIDAPPEGPTDGSIDEPLDAHAHDVGPAPFDPGPRTTLLVKDRWRTARLWRAQGRFSAALTECLAIAEMRDQTWSPIALVEAVRIELGPLAAPELAVELANRMIREWPGDALASEARELRCRALRQLGRAAECTPVTPP